MSKNPAKSQSDILTVAVGHPPQVPFTRELVGGKAFGLLRMVSAGLNVPPGFVLGTECSRQYFNNKNKLPPKLAEEIRQHMRTLEKTSGKAFGSRRNPLLVSVRSGAPVSMPGMMETLLNIGLNDESVRGLIRATGNPRLAWDSYRRLIQSYAEVVFGADTGRFDEAIKAYLKQEGLKSTAELNTASLRLLCNEFQFLFRQTTGKEFPQDPWKQLEKAVAAVFDSWYSERAETYRKLNDIKAKIGTGCLIQSMVFGNAGGTSGSGVGFTRNPANGSNELYVDYLANAQGEDVVSGRHDIQDVASLENRYPAIFQQLQTIKQQLEQEFEDMQDFEFTVEEGELFLLQTRDGKRTPMAALRIAIDLFDEDKVKAKKALQLLDGINLDELYECTLKHPPEAQPIAIGTTASTGVATGIIALDEAKAKQLHDEGKPVVLVRTETSTDDIGAMSLANAVVTVTGGRTSHAAVVARQLGIACVVGCHEIEVDLHKRKLHMQDKKFNEGDYLTVDADHGHVYAGHLEIDMQRPEALLKRVNEWQKKTEKQKATS